MSNVIEHRGLLSRGQYRMRQSLKHAQWVDQRICASNKVLIVA